MTTTILFYFDIVIMSSALKQLNNYGPLMNMICGPDINFFINCYPKFNNFAMQIEPNKCNAPIGFNRTLTFSFNHSGDFAGQTFFKVKLPEIKLSYETSSINPTGFLLGRWIDYIGCYLFNKISIRINNQQISEMSHNMMYIIQEFTTPSAKRQLLDKMLGMVPELVAPVVGSACKECILPAFELMIPLPFWFCTNPSSFIPICCCSSALPIDLVVEVNSLDRLLMLNPKVKYDIVTPLTIECFTNYVYIDTASRNDFVSQPQTYLIEQFVNNGQIEGGNARDIQLNISGICKEIFIAAQHKSYVNPVSTTLTVPISSNQSMIVYTPSNQHTNFAVTAFNQKQNYVNTIDGFGPATFYANVGTTYGDLIESVDFNFAGAKLMDITDASVFNTVEPLWYHTSAPHNSGLHCYSFALNPENAAPTGCVDFTMINNANVFIKLRNHILTQQVTNEQTTYSYIDADMDYVYALNKPTWETDSSQISGSNVGIKPMLNPVMHGSKIDTLVTYTERLPAYYYYIYAINYNFLLFKNGYCGLKYS